MSRWSSYLVAYVTACVAGVSVGMLGGSCFSADVTLGVAGVIVNVSLIYGSFLAACVTLYVALSVKVMSEAFSVAVLTYDTYRLLGTGSLAAEAVILIKLNVTALVFTALPMLASVAYPLTRRLMGIGINVTVGSAADSTGCLAYAGSPSAVIIS